MFCENVKIGSDIEFFLQEENTNEIVSAEGIVRGTKDNPFQFDENNPFYATSLDNVMAEGNIPPAESPMEFYQNVQRLMDYIQANVPNGLKLVSLPSARLDFKYLQTENAMLFGCMPSLNCWTMEEERPEPKGDNLRSAGMHIHVGYDNPDDDVNMQLARAMDLFLGVPSVIIEPANERKAVGYGRAGNFRNQRHGMEYRSLSSHFSSSPELIRWCYNNAMQAVKFVNEGRASEIEYFGDMIQNVINNEDKETAKNIIDRYKILMP